MFFRKGDILSSSKRWHFQCFEKLTLQFMRKRWHFKFFEKMTFTFPRKHDIFNASKNWHFKLCLKVDILSSSEKIHWKLFETLTYKWFEKLTSDVKIGPWTNRYEKSSDRPNYGLAVRSSMVKRSRFQLFYENLMYLLL